MIPVLVSKDINRTRDFYQFLGFEFAAEKHGNGPDHFSTLLKDTVCEIYPELPSKRDKIFFIVWVPDIENCVKNISSYGGKLLEGIKQDKGKAKQILVEDPDGRILKIIEKLGID